MTSFYRTTGRVNCSTAIDSTLLRERWAYSIFKWIAIFSKGFCKLDDELWVRTSEWIGSNVCIGTAFEWVGFCSIPELITSEKLKLAKCCSLLRAYLLPWQESLSSIHFLWNIACFTKQVLCCFYFAHRNLSNAHVFHFSEAVILS